MATPSPRRCPTVNANVPSCSASTRPSGSATSPPACTSAGDLRSHEPAGVARRREAELLGVRLRRHREPEAPRVRAGLGLRHPADGEPRAGELGLPEHVQHVALVLRGVRAGEQVPRAGVVADPTDVVPGGHQVHPELVGPPQERAELDLAVAASARVRGPPGRELLGEVADHPLLRTRRSGRRSRTRTPRSERPPRRRRAQPARSTRAPRRRDARAACASRAPRTPARAAGTRRPRSRRRPTSRPGPRAWRQGYPRKVPP